MPLHTLLASAEGLLRGFEQRNSAAPPTLGAWGKIEHLIEQQDSESLDGWEDLHERLMKIAFHDEIPSETRALAISLIGFSGADFDTSPLTQLLGAQTPDRIRVETVKSIRKTNAGAVGKILLTREIWRGYTAPVRNAVLNALLQREDDILQLLESLESGEVQSWAVPASIRNRLTRSPRADISQRAGQLLASSGTTERKRIYNERLDVLELTPDSENGRDVFGKNCASCHIFLGEGSEVGPDLSDIRAHPPESILMHILVPNWLMVEGYENYVVETHDGQSYSGLISSETDSTLTLKAALGAVNVIPREDIRELYSTSLSLMPEEFEQVISRQELRDLIGFLKGEKSDDN